MSIEFENDSVDVGVQKIEYYIDKDSSLKFLAPYIASSNFNGTIPIVDTMLTASFLKPGMTIAFNGGGVGDQYFPIVSIEFDDLDLTDSPTNLITIKYLDADSIVTSKEIDKNESIAVRYEDWNDKDLGSLGWSITSGGNAIFTNVGVRGEIEATTLDVGGVDGITYDGNTVTIGASVIINAPLTVGASGNFIVSGSAAQDIISNNTTITGGNIATGRIKSTGYSGPGTGSAFSTAGMSINLDDGSIAAPNFKIDSDGNAHFKGTVQSASGNLAGFILSASQISIAGFTMSTASGIYLGGNQEFKVDIQGNLVATSASISGDIRAKSGTFSGSVTAAQIYGASVTSGYFSSQTIVGASVTGGVITGQQIVGGTIIGASGTFTGNLTATNLTASAGNIGGFTITKDSLNTNNFAISTNGGLALGSASQFYVDTSGNLIANSASLTGNITANSGRFLGSVGVNGGGSIYAGNNPNTGQRVILTSSGLFGFDSGNINIFSLPITGSPTIAGFTVVNTGLTGSGQMANMIFGNRGDNAYNITVRGDKTGGQAAAIYTTVNGVATTSNANNGFYLDDTGKMRLAGSNGSLTFDGSNLSVTGIINATTGSFTGDVIANSGRVKKLTIASGKSYPIINLTGTASVKFGERDSGNFILTLNASSKNFSPGDYFYLAGVKTSGSAFIIDNSTGLNSPISAADFFTNLSLNKDGYWVNTYTYQILTASYSSGIPAYDKYFCRLQQGLIASNYDFSQVTGISGSMNFGYIYFGEYSVFSESDPVDIDGIILSTVGPGTMWSGYKPDYIDLSGKFSLGKGNITFDGNNLFVKGNITATSGSFSGALSGATGTFAGSLSSGISISSPTITGGSISGNNISGGTINGSNIFTSLFTIDAVQTANPATITGGENTLSAQTLSNIALKFKSNLNTFTHNGISWSVDDPLGIYGSSLILDELFAPSGQNPSRRTLLYSGKLKNNNTNITSNGAGIQLITGDTYSQIFINSDYLNTYFTHLHFGTLNVIPFGQTDNTVLNSGTIKAVNFIGNGSGLTNLTGANVSGNISGNANNITQYSINQNLGTGNNVSFNQVSAPIFLGQNNVELRQTVISTSAPTNPSSYRAGTLWAVV